jgi:very-short-patch-repair endonuclease
MDINFQDFCQELWEKSYVTEKSLCSSTFQTEFQTLKLVLSEKPLHPRQLLWHAIHTVNQIPVCACGNTLPWHADSKCYRKYCSKKCTGIYTKHQARQTSLEKYGVDHHSKTDLFQDKVRATSQKRFNSDHYSKTPQFVQRMEQTNLEKLGVKYPAQCDQIKSKTKSTVQMRYNVDNVAQNDQIKQKIQQTNIHRYGSPNPLQNCDIRDKVRNTMVARHGAENPQQSTKISLQTALTRKLNHYTKLTYERLHDPAWLQQQNKEGKTLGEIATDLGISGSNVGKYFNKYGLTLYRHFRSAMEKEIFDYFLQQGISVQAGNRKIISPWEIDIWFPDHNVGVEINGAYWHNESKGKDKSYHFNKTLLATSNGIQLLQFFDWEIITQKNQVIDKIQHLLHLNPTRGARTLSLGEISHKRAVEFFSQNHLQGGCNSGINLALVDANNEIYSAMSFGRSRYDKNITWEMLRFACKSGYSVTGGASRLFKFFVKNHMKSTESMVSYCNKRWSQGRLYSQLGFTLDHESPPGYYYVNKQGKYCGTRQKWQKHTLSKKLDIFDPLLTEQQNMKLNGYSRIWDCGQYVFRFQPA